MGAGMLKVFCGRSMHVAVTTLSQRFSEASGAAPEIVFEPMGALQARLAEGETAAHTVEFRAATAQGGRAWRANLYDQRLYRAL